MQVRGTREFFTSHVPFRFICHVSLIYHFFKISFQYIPLKLQQMYNSLLFYWLLYYVILCLIYTIQVESTIAAKIMSTEVNVKLSKVSTVCFMLYLRINLFGRLCKVTFMCSILHFDVLSSVAHCHEISHCVDQPLFFRIFQSFRNLRESQQCFLLSEYLRALGH